MEFNYRSARVVLAEILGSTTVEQQDAAIRSVLAMGATNVQVFIGDPDEALGLFCLLRHGTNLPAVRTSLSEGAAVGYKTLDYFVSLGTYPLPQAPAGKQLVVAVGPFDSEGRGFAGFA